MTRRGKRIVNARTEIDRLKRYPLVDAIALAKKLSSGTKFDETVDLAINLGVDPRHADQMVRGAAALPHGTGKKVVVLVFAKGEAAKEAEEAGADFVGAEDLIEKIQGGWLDFEKAVATPDMMKEVGKVARILGPKKLMPNPKSGTVTPNPGKAVEELKAGRVEFRVEKNGIVHAAVGKSSFDETMLRDNIAAFYEQIMKAKPAAAKGTYVRNVTLTTTMGPGIKVDPATILEAA